MTNVATGTISRTGTPAPVSAPDLVTITGNPASSIAVGSAYSFRATAASSLNSPLTFSVQNLPSWASFNSETGSIAGSPTAGNVGTFAQILVSVSDGTVSAGLAPFSITVLQPHATTAALSWTVPTTAADGTALQLGGYRIYYGSDPASLTDVIDVNDPTASAYTVANLPAGSWYFGMTAYDSNGFESSLSDLVVQDL